MACPLSIFSFHFPVRGCGKFSGHGKLSGVPVCPNFQVHLLSFVCLLSVNSSERKLLGACGRPKLSPPKLPGVRLCLTIACDNFLGGGRRSRALHSTHRFFSDLIICTHFPRFPEIFPYFFCRVHSIFRSNFFPSVLCAETPKPFDFKTPNPLYHSNTLQPFPNEINEFDNNLAIFFAPHRFPYFF